MCSQPCWNIPHAGDRRVAMEFAETRSKKTFVGTSTVDLIRFRRTDRATRARRKFLRASRQRSTGSPVWLRRLHRSPAPHAGPFSTCMHRADAATVSYTDVAVPSRRAVMSYHAGAPCHTAAGPVPHRTLLLSSSRRFPPFLSHLAGSACMIRRSSG